MKSTKIERRTVLRNLRAKKSRFDNNADDQNCLDPSFENQNAVKNVDIADALLPDVPEILQPHVYPNEIPTQEDNGFFSNDTDCDSDEFSSGESENEESSLSVKPNNPPSRKSCHDKENHMCFVVREKLRVWAIKFVVIHSVISALLKILKESFPCLPLHAKNLIKPVNKFVIEYFWPENSLDKSEFVYIGIAEQLKRLINPKNHIGNVLKLQFNIDGLPLFKTGGIEFWPILGRVDFHANIYDPFVIAAYSGVGKPPLLNRFFQKFVDELNFLLENGIIIENIPFKLHVMCFCCDRPARSFVKAIVNHNGFWGCERCIEKGFSVQGRTVFPSISASPRTDKSFREQQNSQHHQGTTPLLNIKPPLNMIMHFPLDIMHLCFLGVMKKLLECWLTNVVNTRMRKDNIMILTQRITNLTTQIPVEFQRQLVPSLGLICKWKATEFRFFLLYIGPLVLKDLLPVENYEHFLFFHMALRMLCSQKLYKKCSSQARAYLAKFVLLFGKLYKVQSIVSNVHSLAHLVDDVEFHGRCLNDLTAFPFENLLGKIKKMVHSGRKPLHQFCRRISEKFSIFEEKPTIPPKFEIMRKKKHGNQKDFTISSFKYENFLYSTSTPNNCIKLKNGDFVLIHKISGSSEKKVRLEGRKLMILGDAYKSPTSSSSLHIHSISQSSSTMEFGLEDIDVKAIRLSIFELADDEKSEYVVPMLH